MSEDNQTSSPDIENAQRSTEAQPVPEAQPALEAPAGPRHVLAIIFDYVRNDGTRGVDRVFLDNLPDLRTAQQLVHVEKMIVDGSQGQLIRALITNWHRLEG